MRPRPSAALTARSCGTPLDLSSSYWRQAARPSHHASAMARSVVANGGAWPRRAGRAARRVSRRKSSNRVVTSKVRIIFHAPARAERGRCPSWSLRNRARHATPQSIVSPASHRISHNMGNRHPPSALHTIHDIAPFSAVAGPHAGIGDEFDLSKFAWVARDRIDARSYGLRVGRIWADFHHLAQGHA